MTETSVRELLVRYNIVVPEIQREYVWGANSELLNKFFADITTGCASNQQKQNDALKSLKENLGNADPDEAIRQYYSSKYMNIGFLYSYRPFYQTNSASNKEDLYLIDGQQRFTTLFLMLVATASRESTLINEFRTLWQNSDGVAFDYKVRDLTHDFLNSLLEHYNGTDFSQTTFYNRKYASDPSIKNMILTLNAWQDYLNNEIKNTENSKEIITKYYHFLMDDVRFWHFKTEKTSQGEELYITMNARGCRLAKNETVRAEMNMEDTQSKKWEAVKDFFWKYRHERNDEEYGMDEFCKWLDILYKDERVGKWEECFDALMTINEKGFFTSNNEKNKYPSRFLYAKNSQGNENELSQSDHFQLLPVLQWYIKFREDLSTLEEPALQKCIADIIAFFKRISNTGNISKSPKEALDSALCLIEKMTDYDIAEICRIEDIAGWKMLRISEEMFKFNLYLDPPNETTREDVEKIIADLYDFVGEKSLETYFNFAGCNNLNNEIADKDDFWKKLCALKEYLFRLNSKHDENSQVFYGSFMPELYDEEHLEDDKVRINKSPWRLDRDILSFIQNYSEDLKDSIDKAWENKAKDFVKEQGDDLKKVSSAKAQLYLYFLYLNYVNNELGIDDLYPWKADRMNFYSDRKMSKKVPQSLFERAYVFAIYNQRVSNFDPIPIHEKLQDSSWLQKLQNWANK